MSAAKPTREMVLEDAASGNSNILERLTSVEAIMSETRDSIRDIRIALVGNDTLKTKGIMQRLEVVEAATTEQNKKLVAWGGAVTALGLVVSYLVSWWKK